MKFKKFLILAAALAASNIFLLTGCGLDTPSTQSTGSVSSLSAETESLEAGNCLLHLRCYDQNQQSLVGATITFYADGKEIFQGITDTSGRLEDCTLPGNEKLSCRITDASGELLAEQTVIFKLSSKYEKLSVLISHEEDAIHELEIPVAKSDFSAALFLTESQNLVFANLMPFHIEQEILDAEKNAPTEPEASEADNSGTDTSDSTDTQDTNSEQNTDDSAQTPAENSDSAPAQTESTQEATQTAE